MPLSMDAEYMRERERRSEQVGEKRRVLASKRQRERERDRLKGERDGERETEAHSTLPR